MIGPEISIAVGGPAVNPERDSYLNWQVGGKSEFYQGKRFGVQTGIGIGSVNISSNSSDDMYVYAEPRLNIILIQDVLALNLTYTIIWGGYTGGHSDDGIKFRGRRSRIELVWAKGSKTGFTLGIERHKYTENMAPITDATTFSIGFRSPLTEILAFGIFALAD